MGKLNTDSGRIMLIRNCRCGGKPEVRHGLGIIKNLFHVSIKCTKCEKSISADYEDKIHKNFVCRELIENWNWENRRL